MRFRIECDAMVHLWVLGKELFKDVGITMLTSLKWQIHVGDFDMGEMVVHVCLKTHFAVLLLFTNHFAVFGLLYNQYFFLVVGNHHEHFSGEISTG